MSKFTIDERGNLVVEDAKIRWRNFAGVEYKYNEKGIRNFCVDIDNIDVADELKDRGWNIRIRSVIGSDEIVPYVSVAVRYGRISPKIVIVTDRKKTYLDETTVASLDYAELESVDLIIRGREWEPGKVKAHLKTGYFTIHKDAFADKYNFDDDPPCDEE